MSGRRRIEALWDELGGFPGQSVFGLNGSRGSEHKGRNHTLLRQSEYLGVVHAVRRGIRLEHGGRHLALAAGVQAILATEAAAEQRGEVAERRELVVHHEVHELDAEGPRFRNRIRHEILRHVAGGGGAAGGTGGGSPLGGNGAVGLEVDEVVDREDDLLDAGVGREKAKALLEDVFGRR